MSSPASPVQQPHLWHRSAGGSSLCGGSRESMQSCRCLMPAVNINKQYSTSHTGIYFHMQQECRLNLKLNTYICTQLHIYKTCSLLAIRILKGFCAIFSHTVQHRESYEGPLSHRCRLALNEVPVTDAAVTLFESKPITLCLVKPSFRGKTRSLRSRQKKYLHFCFIQPCPVV